MAGQIITQRDGLVQQRYVVLTTRGPRFLMIPTGDTMSVSGFYITDSGNKWAPVFPAVPPVDGDFSWFNQGGASTASSQGATYLSIPSSASAALRGRIITAPSAPYTITAILCPLLYAANSVDTLGLVFSDGTKYHSFGVGYNTGVTGGFYILSGKWNTATSYSANYVAIPWGSNVNAMFLRIADNNSDRICSYSSDGANWLTFHSVGRTDFLTATQVGWGGSTANSNAAGITLLSWVAA